MCTIPCVGEPAYLVLVPSTGEEDRVSGMEGNMAEPQVCKKSHPETHEEEGSVLTHLGSDSVLCLDCVAREVDGTSKS